jgi:hypothetical protein
VRTRTLTYFRLPTVPAVLLATFPLGVERRVCCGGERGSVWSVGLNVCSLAFPSCRLLVRTFRWYLVLFQGLFLGWKEFTMYLNYSTYGGGLYMPVPLRMSTMGH